MPAFNPFLHMENVNEVKVDTLAELISNTVNSYLKATNNQDIKTQVILDALMRTYNSFLLKVYIEAIQQEINKKASNTQDGEQVKTDNNQ